jgi:DNA-binding IclR family transcriptional regulator
MNFERMTDNTVVEKSTLLNELSDIRRDGYALDREEFLAGLVCLAVPIIHQKGRNRVCAAALAIQAPVTRMSQDEMIKKIPLLQNAAKAMSATISADVGAA